MRERLTQTKTTGPRAEAITHFGRACSSTDYAMPAPELAVALEQRGFESVWAPEHSRIPSHENHRIPLGSSFPKNTTMQWTHLFRCQSSPSRRVTIKIATGVALIPQRDPIETAKLVASLDQMSLWPPFCSALAVAGIRTRWRTTAPSLPHAFTGCARVHSGHEADMDRGKKLSIMASSSTSVSPDDRSHAEPLRKPLCANPCWRRISTRGARRADSIWWDGWIPLAWGEGIFDQITEFRSMARNAGRDPASLEVAAFRRSGRV